MKEKKPFFGLWNGNMYTLYIIFCSLNFYSKLYGIWIPASQILKRTNYEWFARMNAKQIFQSNFILAKYFVIALSPDSQNGVIEPLTNIEKNEDFNKI